MRLEMSEYNNLLEEAKFKIASIQKSILITAREYIPKLYQTCFKENPNLTSMKIRKMIEKDCEDLWSKRTILDALPDEAKDLDKQKAGRQRNKNKSLNSAAMTAALKLEEKMVLDTFGNVVTDNKFLYPESLNNFDSIDRKNQENLEKNSDKNVENLLDFVFCLKYKYLRQHMTSLFNIYGDNGDIWFHGKIDRNSGQVVEANFGKNNQGDE